MDAQARARARVRHRRPRALFHRKHYPYPGPAEGLPDLPVRRAAVRRGPLRRPGPGRRRRGRDRARASRGGRGEDDPRRRRDRAHRRRGALERRLQPRRHAARRDRDAARTSARPSRRSASSSSCGRRSSSSASPTRRWRRASCAPTRTSPCGRWGRPGIRTRTELKNMNSFNHIARGIEAEVRRQIAAVGVRRRGRPADARLRGQVGHGHRRAGEGGGGRLPLLPRAGSRPARAGAGDCSSGSARAAGAAGRRGSGASSASTASSYYDAEVLNGIGRARGAVRTRRARRRRREGRVERAHERVRRHRDRPGRVNGEELGKVIAARSTDPARRRSCARSRRAATPSSEPTTYLAETVVADTSELEPLVDRILAGNPDQVAAYRGGKQGLLGYFVGQVMKETQGKGGPESRQRAAPPEARLVLPQSTRFPSPASGYGHNSQPKGVETWIRGSGS